MATYTETPTAPTQESCREEYEAALAWFITRLEGINAKTPDGPENCPLWQMGLQVVLDKARRVRR